MGIQGGEGMWGRIGNLIWKEAIQFWRYRLLLVFVLVFPVWNLTSVAGSIAEGITHIPTAVYDQDHSPDSRRLVGMLRNSYHFDPDYYAGSRAELVRLLERGIVRVGLVIPPDFGAGLNAEGQGSTVQVLLDGSEITTSLLAQAYLDGMSYEYVQRMVGEGSGELAVVIEDLEQVEARSRVWFNEGLRTENFQLPAEMAGALAMLAVFLPAVAIVREREVGTLEQLFVTPMRPIELVVGKSLLALVIAYLGFLGMLALNVLHFRVPLRGSLGLLLVLTGYYIFVELGWGLLISVVAKTQGQGLVGAFFLVVLEVILSGQILPVEFMPRAVQAASYLMPNRHYTAIVRAIMLKGAGPGDLWPQVVALGVLGAILYTVAAVRLRKRLD
jgi:ABC-2 type transport system permease protein